MYNGINLHHCTPKQGRSTPLKYTSILLVLTRIQQNKIKYETSESMIIQLPKGRSSSDSAREIMMAAASAIPAAAVMPSSSAPASTLYPPTSDAVKALADEKNWRWGYAKHFVANAALSAQSPEAALAIARAGLQKAKAEFLLGSTPLSNVVVSSTVNPKHVIFESRVIEGQAKPPDSSDGGAGLKVPIGGKMLSGSALLEQINSWLAHGIIEPSAGAALTRVSKNKG